MTETKPRPVQPVSPGSPQTPAVLLRCGSLVFHPETNTVTKNGRPLPLTPKATRLFAVLIRHAGEALSRNFLVREVWETDWTGDTRTLDVHIRWLRQRIEDDPSHPVYLRTIRGLGYCLTPPADPPAGPGTESPTSPAT